VYKQKLNKDDLDKLKVADRTTLLKFLKASDEKVIIELKQKPNRDDIRFLQGASHVVDNLLRVLS
jgi:hypothetical protein